MFDCPKHRKTQKFVSCENAFIPNKRNPANTDNLSLFVMSFSFKVSLVSREKMRV